MGGVKTDLSFGLMSNASNAAHEGRLVSWNERREPLLAVDEQHQFNVTSRDCRDAQAATLQRSMVGHIIKNSCTHYMRLVDHF